MLDIAPPGTEIDPAAIVPCAALGFKPRRALACKRCEYFQGLAVMGLAGDWADRYAIRCNHVIERRTQIIEVIED
jgi:hypothetical protein